MSELHLLSPKGFRAGGAYAQIKTRQINDVGLLVCDHATSAAAAFTTNKVFAAPIAVGRKHIADGKLRGVVVNSGNANACTGARGMRDAHEMCRLAARQMHCAAGDILPSSTGIIGHHLPMTKVARGIVEASLNLGTSKEHALAFGDAILTTDTRRKSAEISLKFGKDRVTIAGICKGAGMIGPRMSTARGLKGKHATMLSYITTDAGISSKSLSKLLQPAIDRSFNAVTIDDHTSTNDTCVILASGDSGARINTSAAEKKFVAALTEVCESLAQQIAADGEGATKVVQIDVRRAKSEVDAKLIARAIANSPLVKCAMNGNDPNWGRIVSAAGMCGAVFDPSRATLTLQGTKVFQRGQPLDFSAVAVSGALAGKLVQVTLDCGGGKASATVWTCDLSKEYVSINADYHT